MTQDKRQTKKAKVEAKAELSQEELIQNALDVQDKIDENNAQMDDEIAKLKEKYEKLNNPLIKSRSTHTSKIDQFWARVFVAHDELSEFLTENDLEALTYCKDISVESKKSEAKEVITVTFTFDNNPFFEDTKLTKTVTISEMDAEIAEQEDEEEFLAPNVETTQSGIKWKEGKKFTDAIEDDEEEASTSNGDSKKRTRDEADLDDEPGAKFFSFFEEETFFDEDIIETLLTDVVQNPFEFYLAADEESDDEDEETGAIGQDMSDDEEAEEQKPVEVKEPVKEEKPVSKSQQKKQKKQEKPQKQQQQQKPKEEAKKQETPKKNEQKKGEQKKQDTPKGKPNTPKQEQKSPVVKSQGGKQQKSPAQQGGKNKQGGKKGGKK